MKEQVIIQPIRITRKKEQQFFQVKLPRDTQRIIGIETGMYAESILPNFASYLQPGKNQMQPNRLMGTLQLKAVGIANLFYAKEIFDRDINLGTNETSVVPPDILGRRLILPIRLGRGYGGNDGNNFLDFPLWSHGIKREEDPLSICGCHIINGQYCDKVGEINNQDIQYRVMLYIWIETKHKQNDH